MSVSNSLTHKLWGMNPEALANALAATLIERWNECYQAQCRDDSVGDTALDLATQLPVLLHEALLKADLDVYPPTMADRAIWNQFITATNTALFSALNQQYAFTATDIEESEPISQADFEMWLLGNLALAASALSDKLANQ